MSRNNTTIALVAGGVLAGGVTAAMLASSPDRAEPPSDTPTVVEAPEPPASVSSEVERAEVSVQSAPGVTPASDEIHHESDQLAFSARFPSDPEMRLVATALREEATTYLRRTQGEAADDDNAGSTPRWEINVVWETVATAGNYASLIGRSSEYRGGAHPVELLDAKLMRIEQGDEIPQREFFTSREWPTPAVAIAVCEEIKAAKVASYGAPTIFDEPIVCAGPRNNIRLEDAKLAFAASQSGSGFGGLHVLYQPYLLGPYAEGSLEVTIPADIFIEDVAKEHRALFTGQPAPLVD